MKGVFILIFFLTGLVFTPILASADGGALTVINFMTPSYTAEHFWTIEKFASPDSWDLFYGDTGTSIFMIRATKGAPVLSNYAAIGKIHVGNYDSPSAIIITGIEADFGDGIDPVIGCPVSFPYSLNPGNNILCSYNISLPDGSTRSATVTAKTESGIYDNSDTDAIDFSTVAPAVINGSATIRDSNGKSWIFSGSSAVSYEKTFLCPRDAGVYENTATIVQTGQVSVEIVTINCHGLRLDDVSTTAYDLRYEWNIEESADTSWLVLPKEVSYPVNYKVTASVVNTAKANAKITGEIIVANSHPSRSAELTSIRDHLSIDGPVEVDCHGASHVPSGESIFCDYDRGDLSPIVQINSASVNIRNYSHAPRRDPLQTGTTEFVNYSLVEFNGNPQETVDDIVSVSDSFIGALGNADVAEAPATFEFSRDVVFASNAVCGEQTLTSAATAIANDTGISVSDSAEIKVFVGCSGGCVSGQGYWRTHNETFSRSRKVDDAWVKVGDWDLDLAQESENENLIPGTTWLSIFWTPAGGNLWRQLAGEWMSAYLNAIRGADIASLGSSLNTAWGWLSANAGRELKSKDYPQAKSWTDLFSNYNKGLLGPATCD